MILRFDSERHLYFVDERPVPSVSSLLRAAGRGVDYAAVPPHVLEQARNRGLHVHTACEYHDLDGDLDMDSVVPRWRGYVEAWIAWKADYAPLLLEPEVMVYHPDLDYAGTLDLRCLVNGVPTIIDRKTSASIHGDNYGLQLAAYSMPSLRAAGPDGTLVPTVTPQRRLIVQLQKTGKYLMQPCLDDHDYEDFRAVIRLARRTARYAISDAPQGRTDAADGGGVADAAGRPEVASPRGPAAPQGVPSE